MEFNYQPTEIEKAYAAGIVDGEGCIFADARKRTSPAEKDRNRYAGSVIYRFGVKVNMTNPEAVDFLREKFGGSVSLLKQQRKNWRPQFCFRVEQRKAVRFLKLVLPYLRVKNKEAELVIRLASLIRNVTHGRGNKIPEFEKKMRNDLVFEIRSYHSKKGNRLKVA